MSFRLKTSRVVGISSLLVFLSFNLGVAVLPGIIAKKNEVDWVDIAELQDEPEVPVIIEEEEESERKRERERDEPSPRRTTLKLRVSPMSDS